MKKMRVAIIGQGRSGRDIHGEYFLSSANDNIEVVAVVDAIEHRRARAKKEFNCDVYADYTELFGRKDIDLVVNASFSQMHYPITKDLLAHGFNVLVEKPFGRTVYECMDLIKTAKAHGVIVAAFHQSLYTPIFQKVKEVVASGVLGEIEQINLRYSGFARRWDWQTLQACCAGGVYNSAPHPIGQGLDLLGWRPDAKVVFADFHKNLTSGDANDFAKILVKAPGSATLDIEVFSSDAYPDPYTFKVLGSKGAMIANNSGEYHVKYIVPEELPPRPVQFESLQREGDGHPMYCHEDLQSHVDEGKVTGDAFTTAVKTYYDMMYNAVMLGKPLEITPEMATEVISVIETAHAMNPMPLLY